MCRGSDHKHLVDKSDRLILPDNVIPSKYDLHIKPNLKDFVFDGQVDITVNIVKPTKTIIIHSIDIDIKSASILNQKATITYYEPEEVAILEFPNELSVTENTVLSIDFTGILNDKLKGFYRSKYTVDGEDRYIGTTQFEATDARRAFPCFDEPALKAVFNIKMTVESHLIALSNMDSTSVVDNADKTKTFTFETTPKMSTYILAFIVGEFDHIESKTKEGIRVRVYKCRGNKESSEFALKVATDALSYFIDYFGIPYPLTKCDHIAIPDFTFGAMENWGLITYRESILLTSDKTTLRTKQRIANVIGHELAHQWFGNLVTMEWWSQLWLNEGFATYMGYLVTDHLFPEWNVWLDFSELYRNGALKLDALDNSHPIEVPVRNSSQVSEIFDAISYNKGSCVIQMLEKRFGESFRKGLNHYLGKHSYQNTNTEDLWDSLTLASGINVKEFVDSFTKYSGYPVVSFKPTSTPGTFELTQKKFRLEGEEKADDPIWNCFIKVQTDSGTHEVIFDKKSSTFTVPNFNPNGWIKPNYGQTGYYRIAYTPEIIKGLIPIVKSMELPATDRLGLLSDVYSLCKTNTIPISTYMDLVMAFENEKESNVWDFIIETLGQVYSLSDDQAYSAKLAEVIIKLLKPVAKRLGFDPKQGESASDVLLRGSVCARLGVLGDEETVAECRKRFEQFKTDPASLPSDIRNCVLATIVRNGGESEQQELINQYLKTNLVAEKNSILMVISLAPKQELVEKALEFSLSKEVRTQDCYIIWFTLPNRSRVIAWEFFTKNFNRIDEMFKSSSLYGRMITGALSNKMDDKKYAEVEKFFAEHPTPICERNNKQNLENIRIDTKFFNSFNNDLSNWLQNK
ncbi:hypothetical protein DICPUDRAFT_45518 [Dictyostelium purpureum]|uniref:Aminopeptidase n=1 Tax=Dictyostelium purpureum TaxID=5786 RepID=F0ZAQ6_DICPU|nr:uncharacterized protein DICPUDRAFT_45518 [Dictyostelium purpureum]EGC38962.1 hypothetical protein DICPUDRAFT_45518 [Dictyostelium purpureum]|eukprot:XP_003284527.1 hypothetical protein DICPUDRAFT_45518 [Dictyostelium purpureum]